MSARASDAPRFHYLDAYSGRGEYRLPPAGVGAWESGVGRVAASADLDASDPFVRQMRALTAEGRSWGGWRWVAERLAAQHVPATLSLCDLYEGASAEARRGLPDAVVVQQSTAHALPFLLAHAYEGPVPDLTLLDPPYAPHRRQDYADVAQAVQTLAVDRGRYLVWYPLAAERWPEERQDLFATVPGVTLEAQWGVHATATSTTVGAGMIADAETARALLSAHSLGRLAGIARALGAEMRVLPTMDGVGLDDELRAARVTLARHASSRGPVHAPATGPVAGPVPVPARARVRPTGPRR